MKGRGNTEHSRSDHRGGYLREKLAENPDLQILFVGSLNCIRHKPFGEMGQLMREGKMSFLCPTMSDLSAGRYLRQIREAAAELSKERDTKDFLIVYGCQWVILSTDEELIREELRDEYGIRAEFYDDSHLENGDHD